jgi:hypothetical protein
MLNPNLTKDEALWLLNDFQPKMGGIVNGKSMGKYFIPARELITGKPSEAPGCGCHFLAYAKMTQSMFNQHKEEITVLANATEEKIQTTKTRRGRKKKTTTD